MRTSFALPLLVLASPSWSLLAAAQERLFDVTHAMLPTSGADVRVTGDLDGDGDVDTLRLWNDGLGVFSPIEDAHWAFGTVAHIADLDGDGDEDITSGSEDKPNVYANDGVGGFTLLYAIPVNDVGAPATGDVDGDGDLDWLLAGTQGARLVANNGASAPTVAPLFPTFAFPPQTTSVALFDADGDGDLDAYAGNWGKKNNLFRNLGGLQFEDLTATHLPNEQEKVHAVSAGDIDADGDVDVWIGVDGQNLLQENDGTGHYFFSGWKIPTLVDITRDGELRDLDGDGDLDAYVAEMGAPDRILVNGGAGIFTEKAGALPSLSEPTVRVAIDDVDGDGDLDVLQTNSQQPSRLWLNDGQASFIDSAHGLPYVKFGERIVLGDADGDGGLDALVLRRTSGLESRLLLNDGTGVLSDASDQMPLLDEEATDGAFADFDGDGDLDVIVVSADATHRLLMNDGTGFFVDESYRVPASAVAADAVAAADFDGDGDVDLFIARHESQDQLYRNDGAGVFAEVVGAMPHWPTSVHRAAVGDLDGDGDLDLFLATDWGLVTWNRVRLNDGSGVFPADTVLFENFESEDVALGDVDGDGDLDVAVTSQKVWLNDGTGAFTESMGALPASFELSERLRGGDFDGDGDFDLWCGDKGQNDRLFLNQGAGTFVEQQGAIPEVPSSYARDLAVGDFDGDGDLDVMRSSQGSQVFLFTNFTRQLTRRALPGVGKGLRLELHGEPSTPWYLAASPGAASLPLPGFGVLYLDPGHLLTAGGGTLDALGAATADFAVPANPSLIGATLHWQAMLGAPLTLTNRDRTTFGAY